MLIYVMTRFTERNYCQLGAETVKGAFAHGMKYPVDDFFVRSFEMSLGFCFDEIKYKKGSVRGFHMDITQEECQTASRHRTVIPLFENVVTSFIHTDASLLI